MQKVNADALDFRSLRLLRFLLETASVSRTAELMEMSQPAASRSVGRLRAVLGDPLLVRTRRGYVLTPRAEALRQGVDTALAAAQSLLASSRFDPIDTERSFTIATTDYGAVVVMSPATRSIAREAPHARVVLLPFDRETMRRLEIGSIDLALWAEGTLSGDFHCRRLFTEDYAVLARRGHALARERPRAMPKALGRYRHVALLYPGDHGLVEDDILRHLGVPDANVAVRAPYFSCATAFLIESDLVMCVPSRMAAHAVEDGRLVHIPLSVPSLRFEYRAIWHERVHRDPGHRWLRDVLVRSLA